MTGTIDSLAVARLRKLVEQTPGTRVVVSREDLLALLGQPAAATPAPGRESPPAAESRPARALPAPVEHRRGRPQVVLTPDYESAKRFARAAWATTPNWLAEHGLWEDAEPCLTWAVVEAALRAIQHLVGGQPEQKAVPPWVEGLSTPRPRKWS